MRDEVRRILDGEASADEARALLDRLSPAERRDAEALLGISAAARRLERAMPPEDFAMRAMARVRARRPPRRSAWTWLRSPRVTPLGAIGGAAAAAVLAAAVAGWLLAPASAPDVATVTARLDLHAPGARSVAVAGTFNAWRPEATPLRRGEGGIWTVRVPLVAGRRYEYMFVVDGEWVPDPSASSTADDGFGRRNAVLDL